MNMNDARKDFHRPIRYRDVAEINVERLAEFIKTTLNEKGVPANVRTDTVKSGGLFGSTYPCIVISHPNPPQSYFDHVIIINGVNLNFKYWGMSKAVFNRNKKEHLRDEGKFIQAALINDDEMVYQVEFNWHHDVNNVIEEIFDA